MNQVIQFTEKNESNSKGWINSGLSYLHTDFFLDLNDHPFSLEQDFYEILIKKRVLNVIKLKTEFIDIGIPADYFEFCNWYKSKSEK
jgi:NDP-sugar pyrophosphorylase family protein